MTDEDRDLLKLAATACGMLWIDDCRFGLTIQRTEGGAAYNFHWNPLRDDGDALRLAVKLDLCLSQWPRHMPPDVMVGYRKGPNDGANLTENYGDDPYAATRRALVRAAAELGKMIQTERAA